jgi:hypothetical protein
VFGRPHPRFIPNNETLQQAPEESARKCSSKCDRGRSLPPAPPPLPPPLNFVFLADASYVSCLNAPHMT